MKPELTIHQGAAQDEARHVPSPCHSPGCYRELSSEEFWAATGLTVLVLKGPADVPGFARFRQVLHAPDAGTALALAQQLPPGTPLGLVCPNGDCSSRLAIRLSRMGHPVFHLAGGLWDWHTRFRGSVPATA